MTSSKPNASGNIVAQKDIISQLGYDKFGQRTYLRYGNGTETTYMYEDANEKRRRLVNMQVRQLGTTASGAGALVTPRTFVNNKYTYDALSNVKSIHNNSVALPTDTQIGGRSIQNYTYDDLNRLEAATGTFVGRNDQTLNPGAINYASQNYALTMSYDNQHNIVAKNQLHRKATTNGSGVVQGAWSKVEKSSYGLVYEDYNTAGYDVDGYVYNQPHAPRKIVDQPDSSTPNCCDAANDPRVKIKTYDYDHNGNQTKVSQTTCNTPNATVLRKNLWDEENRLRAIDLNPEATNVHPIAIYTYDAGGERIIKHNSTNVAIYENALKVGEKTQTDFMLYPSGMLVARPAADDSGGITYTKHYFAGTQRVSSKIGTTTNLGNFLEEWQQQEQSSPSYPAITTQAQMDNAKNAANKVYTAFGISYTTPAGNTSFTPIAAFTPPSGAGGLETDQYFFHPDHLGSSNYITNFVGEVSQHMEYFAFGETFIEEHKNSHNSPYKFNGKELDEESGLYYYGARYYDPRISIWASVDPLANFNPFMDSEHYIDGQHNGGVFNHFNHNSYGYCYQNPVRLIDPNGKQVDSPATIGIYAHARFANYMNSISGTSGNWKPEYNLSEFSQRADLVYYGGNTNNSGKGSVWELKPVSWSKGYRKKYAISQLMGYVVSLNQPRYNKGLSFYPGTNGGPKPFEEDKLVLTTDKYIFTYYILNPLEGLIYYESLRKKEEKEDEKVRDGVPDEISVPVLPSRPPIKVNTPKTFPRLVNPVWQIFLFNIQMHLQFDSQYDFEQTSC